MNVNHQILVEFADVQKTYDGTELVIKNLNLKIHKGEFLTLLGPSGSGKTTCLMMLAGFETPTHGVVMLGDIELNNVPPHKRGIGMVFQNYALFPHMSVYENLAFPLEVRKLNKVDVKARVEKVLEMVELGQFGARRPAQLSGGQQQRVALARALATSPGLLLLDEPLSALDAKVRVFLRKQIRDLQRKLGVTTIMVTHDQEEAQTMADRIFVMKDGEIIQSGTPNEIYTKANSPFIASFIGSMNFIPAVVSNSDKVQCNNVELSCNTVNFKQNDSVQIAIRPEDIQIKKENPDDNILPATIKEIEFLGSFQRVYFESKNLTGDLIMVDIPSSNARKTKLNINQEIDLYFSKEDVRVYPV